MPQKNITTKVDYIIVGQGLAGSCAALQLIKRGAKVMVIDRPSENRCSVVAAGLFNPITGKFLKKSWLAEKLFPYLFEFYREAEKTLDEKFLYEIPIYRPFESTEEQNDWMARSENPSVRDFVKEIYTAPKWPDQVNNPFGGLLINYSGYLDVNAFLISVRKFLKTRNQFREVEFNYGDLQIAPAKVAYQELEAKQILFCEGARVNFNPVFNWVPVHPMKGEVLEIEMNQWPKAIFNRGVYVVPFEGKKFNVGATYEQPPFEMGVTEKGKQEIESKLKALLSIPFLGVGCKWGVRPTTPNRRPILGAHPDHKNAIIFNGLGTKGVSLAPYFSNHLAGWLNGEHEITTEVNIHRFYPLYSGLS